MSHELEDELRKRLKDLHREVSRARESGEKQELEIRTGYFEIEWLDRLVIEQRAETRGSRAGIELAAERETAERHLHEGAVDREKLAAMSMQDQLAYWNGTVITDAKRARDTQTTIKAATENINEYFAHLRQGLVHALQDIEQGNEPNLVVSTARTIKAQARRAENLSQLEELMKEANKNREPDD